MTISFVRPELGFVFFEIELTNAIVQDMTLGASDVLAQTSEELSFGFQTIKLTDIILSPDGSPGGRVVVECDFVLRRCT